MFLASAAKRGYIMKKLANHFTAYMISIVTLFAVSSGTARSQEVEMPEVIGLRPRAALARLREAELGEVEMQDSISESEPGFVIWQEPEAGVEVAVGDPVRLWVSVSREESDELVEVPDLLEHTLGEATEILAQSGLTRGEVTSVPSQAETRTVIRQSPGPGDAVPPETPVDLVISAGPRGEAEGVVVPDLTGRTLGEAEEILAEPGLLIGRVNGRDRDLEGGHVTGQDPPPGAVVAAGTRVNLVLASREIARVPWPPVVGGLLLVLAIGSYAIARVRTGRKSKTGAGGTVELRPRMGGSASQLRPANVDLSGPEVCLKPVPDAGSQSIQVQGQLTGKERRRDA